MTETFIRCEIKSYFHLGTGHGIGQLVNLSCHRDPHGLPCLPGRTLKGLCRDAMWRLETWGHLEAGTTDQLFGTRFHKSSEGSRYETSAGLLIFDDAILKPQVGAWLQHSDLLPALFRQIQATAIDGHSGCQLDGSLRAMEVVVPLCLRAAVSSDPNHQQIQPHWQTALGRCLPLIRGLGLNRNRGLGRVHLSLEQGS